MTSQTGKQMITILIFLKISTSKGNKAMKHGQLIKCNMINFVFKNRSENMTGRLAPDLFLLSAPLL